jgi:hypothetical protein
MQCTGHEWASHLAEHSPEQAGEPQGRDVREGRGGKSTEIKSLLVSEFLNSNSLRECKRHRTGFGELLKEKARLSSLHLEPKAGKEAELGAIVSCTEMLENS